MTIVSKITAIGVSSARAANGNGFDLHITHIAVGDAAGYSPTGQETALRSRREVAVVSSGSKISANQIAVAAALRASSYTGAAYTIGELGFYAGHPDSGGILFALASDPTGNFGGRGSGALTDFLISFTLGLNGLDATVNVTVDPTAGQSMLLIADHVGAANPHPQYEPVNTIPVGAVVPFYDTTAPRGWLEANGQLVSRSTYAALWAHAQSRGLVQSEAAWPAAWTMFGAGDGSTTFRLPDLRAEHIRAADNGRGIDAGRVIGSWQADALKSHSHIAVIPTQDGDHASAENPPALGQTDRAGVATSYPTTAVGAAENRVRNVALLLCIKAGAATLPAGPAPSSAPVPAPAPPPSSSPSPAPAPTPAPSPGPATAPTAAFVASPTYGYNNFIASFTDQSTGNPTSWLWNFGDGSTSTAQNPTHQYTGGGSYTITLTVSNASGSDSEVKAGYITLEVI